MDSVAIVSDRPSDRAIWPLLAGVLALGIVGGVLTALAVRATQVEEPTRKILDSTGLLIGLLTLGVTLLSGLVILNGMAYF